MQYLQKLVYSIFTYFQEYELLEEDSFTEDADANLAATKETEKDVEADETVEEAEVTDATKETKEEHEGADEQPGKHANGKSADSANEENNRSRNGTSLELPEKAQDKFIRARRLSHESVLNFLIPSKCQI